MNIKKLKERPHINLCNEIFLKQYIYNFSVNNHGVIWHNLTIYNDDIMVWIISHSETQWTCDSMMYSHTIIDIRNDLYLLMLLRWN